MKGIMMKRNAKRGKLQSVFLILLCFCMLLPVLSSCSKPPELSEISDRLRELVEASYEINMIFYGEGLETYERVTDPRETTEVFEKEETGELFHYYEFEDKTYGRVLAYRQNFDSEMYQDSKTGIKYYYYHIYDDKYGKIIVAKSLSPQAQYYIQITDAPKEGVTADYTNEAKGEWGYLLSDFTYDRDYEDNKYTFLRVSGEPIDGEEAFYADAEEKIYCYLLPDDYEEPVFESYYTKDDPEDYDYVRQDGKYLSISEIKSAAEAVYSKEFLESMYDMMFVGTVGADGTTNGISARYKEYQDEMGNITLMKSNTYNPLIKETRLYLFDTAEIVEPSNGDFVTIAVDSYLPSKPDKILNVTVTMVLENGVWMLDGPTY